MLKYLFIKNVKTDDDFRKYQLLSLSVIIVAAVIFVIYGACNTTSPWLTARIFNILWLVLGVAGFVTVYVRAVLKQLNNPKLLRAKRIEATDERRAQLVKKTLEEIGIGMFVLVVGVLVFSPKSEITVTIPKLYIAGVLMLVVLYFFCRTRK
ncbi:MAG: hypothetical protein WAZ61_05220 [Lactococcus chungangensis]|jgi:hypothetical protein|uniref:Uncharacterized protein n=1 Tax=Pseudolactococcus chungangensis TaxID=451457 RepID=A0A847J810_9LACT|nr:hypothetical protein [Lactococcus chungangensis]